MEQKKILVIGSSNTDMVVTLDRLPKPGETILGGNFLMNPGGKGANQAVAASRIGGEVIFITKTGDDSFGHKAVECYQKENINTQFIKCDKYKASGIALINVDKRGENCISVAPGANAALLIDDLKDADQAFENVGILLMQLEIPIESVEYAARTAQEKGIRVILNPAPVPTIPLSDELLANVNIIIPNETEAELISGIKVTDEKSAEMAAQKIRLKGVETVIITLGSKGAYLKSRDRSVMIPTTKVVAKDTTAAGDTFCGAFAVALSEGYDIEEGVKFANKCSAISVTRSGAQSSIPYRNEIGE